MTTRREIFKLGAVSALGLAGLKGGDDDVPHDKRDHRAGGAAGHCQPSCTPEHACSLRGSLPPPA